MYFRKLTPDYEKAFYDYFIQLNKKYILVYIYIIEDIANLLF